MKVTTQQASTTQQQYQDTQQMQNVSDGNRIRSSFYCRIKPCVQQKNQAKSNDQFIFTSCNPNVLPSTIYSSKKGVKRQFIESYLQDQENIDELEEIQGQSYDKIQLNGGVFNMFQDQSTIYNSTCKDLVGKLLKGQNSTVLIYGPRECGKSHTFVGGSKESKGIAIRAAEELITKMQRLQQENRKNLELKLSIYCIFNNNIYDTLLKDEKSLCTPKEIKEISNYELKVKKLQKMTFKSKEEFKQIYKIALKNQIALGEQLNEQSFYDKSHLAIAYTIYLQKNNIINFEKGNNKEQVEYLKTRLTLMRLGDQNSESAESKSSYCNDNDFQILQQYIQVMNTPRQQSAKTVYNIFKQTNLTICLRNTMKEDSNLAVICCVGSGQDVFNTSQNALKYIQRLQQCCIQDQLQAPSQQANPKKQIVQEKLLPQNKVQKVFKKQSQDDEDENNIQLEKEQVYIQKSKTQAQPHFNPSNNNRIQQQTTVIQKPPLSPQAKNLIPGEMRASGLLIMKKSVTIDQLKVEIENLVSELSIQFCNQSQYDWSKMQQQEWKHGKQQLISDLEKQLQSFVPFSSEEVLYSLQRKLEDAKRLLIDYSLSGSPSRCSEDEQNNQQQQNEEIQQQSQSLSPNKGTISIQDQFNKQITEVQEEEDEEDEQEYTERIMKERLKQLKLKNQQQTEPEQDKNKLLAHKRDASLNNMSQQQEQFTKINVSQEVVSDYQKNNKKIEDQQQFDQEYFHKQNNYYSKNEFKQGLQYQQQQSEQNKTQSFRKKEISNSCSNLAEIDSNACKEKYLSKIKEKEQKIDKDFERLLERYNQSRQLLNNFSVGSLGAQENDQVNYNYKQSITNKTSNQQVSEPTLIRSNTQPNEYLIPASTKSSANKAYRESPDDLINKNSNFLTQTNKDQQQQRQINFKQPQQQNPKQLSNRKKQQQQIISQDYDEIDVGTQSGKKSNHQTSIQQQQEFDDLVYMQQKKGIENVDSNILQKVQENNISQNFKTLKQAIALKENIESSKIQKYKEMLASAQQQTTMYQQLNQELEQRYSTQQDIVQNLQREVKNLQTNVQQGKEKIKEYKLIDSQRRQTEDTLQEDCLRFQTKLGRKKAKLHDARQQLVQKDGDINDLREQINGKDEQIATLSNTLSNINQQFEDLKVKISQQSASIFTKEQEMIVQQSQMRQLQQQLRNETNIREEEQNKVAKFSQKMEELEDTITSLEAKIIKQKQKFEEDKKQTMDELAKKVQRKKEKNQTLKTQQIKLSKDLQEKETQIILAQTTQTSLTKKIDDQDKLLAAFSNEREKYKIEIDEYIKKLEALQQENLHNKTLISSLESKMKSDEDHQLKDLLTINELKKNLNDTIERASQAEDQAAQQQKLNQQLQIQQDQEISQIEAKVDALMKEMMTLREENQELKKRETELKKQIQILEDLQNNFKEKYYRVKSSNKNLKVHLKETEDKAKDISIDSKQEVKDPERKPLKNIISNQQQQFGTKSKIKVLEEIQGMIRDYKDNRSIKLNEE